MTVRYKKESGDNERGGHVTESPGLEEFEGVRACDAKRRCTLKEEGRREWWSSGDNN